MVKGDQNIRHINTGVRYILKATENELIRGFYGSFLTRLGDGDQYFEFRSKMPFFQLDKIKGINFEETENLIQEIKSQPQKSMNSIMQKLSVQQKDSIIDSTFIYTLKEINDIKSIKDFWLDKSKVKLDISSPLEILTQAEFSKECKDKARAWEEEFKDYYKKQITYMIDTFLGSTFKRDDTKNKNITEVNVEKAKGFIDMMKAVDPKLINAVFEKEEAAKLLIIDPENENFKAMPKKITLLDFLSHKYQRTTDANIKKDLSELINYAVNSGAKLSNSSHLLHGKKGGLNFELYDALARFRESLNPKKTTTKKPSVVSKIKSAAKYLIKGKGKSIT